MGERVDLPLSQHSALENHIYNISEAAKISGVSEMTIHNLITHYNYIDPPTITGYHNQKQYNLRPVDVQYLEIYKDLRERKYAPREIIYLKNLYLHKQKVEAEIKQILAESFINHSNEILENACNSIVKQLFNDPIVSERDKEALETITEKLS